MATKKILFFQAGATATDNEKIAIANLTKLVEPPYSIGVRNKLVDSLHGTRETADFIAGTTTGFGGDGEPFEDVPVFDAADAAEGYATIVDGQVITIGGDDYTFTVEDGVITDITVA